MEIQSKKFRLLLISVILFVSTNFIYAQVVKPQFKGGKKALKEYLEKKSEGLEAYYLDDLPDDIGVKVRFLVGKTGQISAVSIISGDRKLGNKAIRTVTSMTPWIPGKKNGVTTAMYDTLHLITSAPPIEVRDINEIEEGLVISGDIAISELPGNHKTYSGEDKPYDFVEQMPNFPGGDREMMKFIAENIKYPEKDDKNHLQRVIVRFVIKKDGTVADAIVTRGTNPLFDEEALRVINSMPKWTPGKQNGENVSVYYTIPVVFKFPSTERN